MAIEKIASRVGPVFVIRPDDDTDIVYLRARVGSLPVDGRAEPFLRAAMAGNRFGSATEGAVLSLADDGATVNLTLRLEAGRLAESEDVRRAVDRFAAVLHVWQERLATYVPSEGKEVSR